MSEYTFLSTITPQEQAAYDAWCAQRRYRVGGTALLNAFLDGYRARGRELTASPAWDALSHHDQLDHIEACWGCTLCAEGRAFGSCTSCGDDPVEALPPEGLSRCCGSVVNLWGPE